MATIGVPNLYPTYGNVAVSTTPILIVAANAARQEIWLCNYSVAPDCFIGFDANVTTTTGFPLFASGNQQASRGEGSTYLGDLWGVTSSGTADIRFKEVTR